MLADAESAGLLRTPRVFAPDGAVVLESSRSLTSFASNDYLGLAQHPALREASSGGASGAGASPVVTGTSPSHRDAEAALAGLSQLPAVRLFSSAYCANLGVLGSLFGRADLLLSDALNHASLIDGCRLSRARVEVYRHCDLDHLRSLLRAHRASARVVGIVTESAFSMDGDVADLAQLRALADEHQCALVVDEAHALGVVGREGRGLCALAGVRPDVLVGGLGKAFGLAGGFVAGSVSLSRAIDNFARPFVYSTAILPGIARAIPASVSLVRGAVRERQRLQDYAVLLRARAAATGRRVTGRAPGVILPIILGAPTEAMVIASRLAERGFLVPVMRPPTVPGGTSRLRITPTALHSPDQIEALAAALEDVLG